MSRRPLPKVEGAPRVERGVIPGVANGPAPAATFQPPAAAADVPDPAVLVGTVVERPALPEPHDPLGTGPLNDREREELAACEAAIAAAQRSFITRGRALHVIREGRHYRDHGYATFDDYLREHWDIDRKDASRDILTYRLGERLSQICDKINRDQVLKLKPIADQFGEAAAVTVYETVAEVKGGKVTAALLRTAVDAVPNDRWDKAEAVASVRAALSETNPPPAAITAPGGESRPDPAEAFVAATGRAWGALRQVNDPEVIRAVARANPGYVRKVVDDLRDLITALEEAIPS